MSAIFTRRGFILSLLGAAVGVSLSGRASTGGPAALRLGLFQGRTIDVTSIVAFTGRYLARHPEEGGFEALVRLLFDGRTEGDPREMKRALLGRIREDFVQGRLENLDGWLLAVTEVRLWCLYLAVTT